MATWKETNSTLHNNNTMEDPCTLDNCDHHFCRVCILGALSGRDSCCPECGLPAWVKDLKSNRQLTNLVHLVLHMRELTTGGGPRLNVEGAQFSSKRVPTPSSSAITSNSSCTPSSLYGGSLNSISDLPGPSHACSSFQDEQINVQHCSTLAGTTAPPRRPQADRDEAAFCKPHVGKQLLRRRLKVSLKPNLSLGVDGKPALLYPEAENLNSCSKWKAVGQLHRLPLEIVNHRRAKSLPGHDILPPKRMHYGDTDIGPASSKEHGDAHTNLSTCTSLRKSFGHPEMRRKKSDSIDEECATNASLQFPFSPLVTKTRNYAKLNSRARVQRLQRAGCLAQRRLRSNSGEMVPKLRRVHQLKMEAFVKANTMTGGCMKAAGRSGDDVLTQTVAASVQHEGSSVSLESPVPSTPSSAHARTMRRNIKGETPLHIAAIKGDVSAVQALLQEGADVNAKDHAGWTPLHEACNHGYVEVASLLLDHGALVNVPGFENDTPLHDAVTNGHVRIASLLVSRGANTSIRNCKGRTAHELAVTTAMREALTQVTSFPNLLVLPNTIKSPHASPVLNGMPDRTVLLATGLKGYQKTQMEELAHLLGAQVVNSFSPEVSHVITVCDKRRCCPRTLKFLCAVALGKWIISFQWISKCLQERNWVDETPYEVQGVMVGDSTLITEGPRKGRNNASQKAPGLFDGCQFYFTGIFSPPRASKEDLSHLVKLAGGRVLAREPRSQEETTRICPYHAAPQSLFINNHTFIVYDTHSEHSPAKVRASNVITVPSSWLLDCLSHFELLDVPE